jgi:hypothetical protein
MKVVIRDRSCTCSEAGSASSISKKPVPRVAKINNRVAPLD